MTIEDYTTNEECLIFLLKNDKYFKRLLNSWKLAAKYISENKRYSFYYKSLSSNRTRVFNNNNFENMIRRPSIYLDQTYNCCIPTSVDVEMKQYRLDETEQDYMKDYGMAYYYLKRIVGVIDTLKKNIQDAKINEPLLRSRNITCDVIPKQCYIVGGKCLTSCGNKNCPPNSYKTCKEVKKVCIDDPIVKQRLLRGLYKNDMIVYDFKGYNQYPICGFNQNYNDINFLTGKKLQITYDEAEGDFAKNLGKTGIINFIDKENWSAYFVNNRNDTFRGTYTFEYNPGGETLIDILHDNKTSDGSNNIITLNGFVEDYKNEDTFTEVSISDSNDNASGRYKWIVQECLNIAERCSVSIVIPKLYFPNLDDSEIKKSYNIRELINIYNLALQ